MVSAEEVTSGSHLRESINRFIAQIIDCFARMSTAASNI